MQQLTPLETEVIAMLLAGSHGILRQLRVQLDGSQVGERLNTGHGFYRDFDVPEETALSKDVNFELGDVDAEIPGMTYGAGFLLFVRDGRITCLEGFSYDEPWPSVETGYRLKYRESYRILPFVQDDQTT